MRMRAAGFAGLVVVLSTLIFVATTNAGKTVNTTYTKPKCMEDCQIGLIRCNQSGKCADGRSCNQTACYKQLSECQTLLCGNLPAE